MSELSQRLYGALIGLAVGDALGTTLEFQDLGEPPFTLWLDGPHREITGGGPFRVAPGQVTDDTQMAVCLAASLRERGGFDQLDVARRYREWSRHAFDIGTQTRGSLMLLDEGLSPTTAGRRYWEQTGRRAAGNGSLMRCAPIGVAFAGDGPGEAEELLRASLADSAITHFDPRCRLACASFNAAIAALVRSEEVERALDSASMAIDAGAAALLAEGATRDEEAAAAREALHQDLALAVAADPDLYREPHLYRHQGFVRVAFRLAMWTLVHAPSYEAGLLNVVNRGGDSDTNGAIAGALLGARFRLEAIPARWREKVLGELPDWVEECWRVGGKWHPAQLHHAI